MTDNKIFISMPLQQFTSLILFLDALYDPIKGPHYANLLPHWSKLLKDHLRNSSSSELDCIISIQCSDGHWNHDPYMHGMANGLILAQSMLNHEPNPKYLDAPLKWFSGNYGVKHYHSPAWHRWWPAVLHSLAKFLSLFSKVKNFWHHQIG